MNVSLRTRTLLGTLRPRVPFPSIHRHYTSSPPLVEVPEAGKSSEPVELPPAPSPSGVSPLSTRGLISVSGRDARKFLNGAVTTDIPLTGNLPLAKYGAFLTAQGKILHDVIIYPDTLGIGSRKAAESFLIECDARHVSLLAQHIKKYQLRARFDVRALDDGEVGLWAAWDNNRIIANDKVPSFYTSGSLATFDPRLSALGSRILTRGSTTSPAEVLGLPESNGTAYHIHRILNGVAEGQRELTYDGSLPQESNLDMFGGIHYNKGCYVGQELTIRTKHRGVVRKRILPVILYEPGEEIPWTLTYKPIDKASIIPKRADIIRAIKRRGRPLGRWLGGVGNIGLALCRLGSTTGIEVPGENPDHPASYNPFAEFEFRWEVPGLVPKRLVGAKKEDGSREPDYTIMVDGMVDRKLNVKPVVPEWMAVQLAEELSVRKEIAEEDRKERLQKAHEEAEMMAERGEERWEYQERELEGVGRQK